MSRSIDSRGHRTPRARFFLVVAFLLQRLGDASVVLASLVPANSQPILRGVAIGALIWTTALLIGVWRRLRWARYLVTGFGWLYVGGLSFYTLYGWQEEPFDPWSPRALPVAGALLYLIATVLLTRSRQVRHFANR